MISIILNCLPEVAAVAAVDVPGCGGGGGGGRTAAVVPATEVTALPLPTSILSALV